MLDPNSNVERAQPGITSLQENISQLEDQLSNTEVILNKLVNSICAQHEVDAKTVPSWLMVLIPPSPQRPSVPRVDVASGHTIG